MYRHVCLPCFFSSDAQAVKFDVSVLFFSFHSVFKGFLRYKEQGAPAVSSRT